MKKRILEEICFSKDFGRQMRFIAGPRQSGKTTLAKSFLKAFGSDSLYYNWDEKSTRLDFLSNPHFFYEQIKKQGIKKPWICFDEIHKTKNWKNFLKAHFDHYENKLNTIVTGSARLNLFRRSGDSLAGRYFLFHLYPFSLSELNQRAVLKEAKLTPSAFIESRLDTNSKNSKQNLNSLFTYGGFPEPLFKESESFHRIWQRDYLEKLIYEDIKDISQIKNLDDISLLVKLLPERVGSPLSLNSLREDLELNHETVRNHIKYLNLLYLTFQIKPYSKRQRYSVKKEQKLYFHDWSRIQNESCRFENFVACELLSLTSLWTDAGLANAELYYLRQKNKSETDFLIVKDEKPWLMIEVKLNDTNIESHHYRLSETFGNIPIVQIILNGDHIIKKDNNAFVISAHRFF